MKNIEIFRQEIDTLDEELIQILAQRFDICRQVAIYKHHVGMLMMQPDRVNAVKARCSKLGEKHGVNPEFLRRLYELIINESCQIEDKLMQSSQAESKHLKEQR
jgi:4-amino-4-deoxychorismate mutase